MWVTQAACSQLLIINTEHPGEKSLWIIVASKYSLAAQCTADQKGQRGRNRTSSWCQSLGIGGLLPLAVLILLMGKPSKQGCELVFMLALTDWESSLFYQI